MYAPRTTPDPLSKSKSYYPGCFRCCVRFRIRRPSYFLGSDIYNAGVITISRPLGNLLLLLLFCSSWAVRWLVKCPSLFPSVRLPCCGRDLFRCGLLLTESKPSTLAWGFFKGSSGSEPWRGCIKPIHGNSLENLRTPATYKMTVITDDARMGFDHNW